MVSDVVKYIVYIGCMHVLYIVCMHVHVELQKCCGHVHVHYMCVDVNYKVRAARKYNDNRTWIIYYMTVYLHLHFCTWQENL